MLTLQSVQCDAGNARILAQLEAIRQRQQDFGERLADIETLSRILKATFEYSEDNVSAVSIPDFKAGLIGACSSKKEWISRGQLVWCMLLGEYLPNCHRYTPLQKGLDKVSLPEVNTCCGKARMSAFV